MATEGRDRPKLSDAELLTLAVLQILQGYAEETRWLRHAHRWLRPMFPYLPGQSGYNKRLRKSTVQMQALIRLLAAETNAVFDDVWLVDSTPSNAGAPARRITQRLLALTAALWHNHHAGQPVLRSLVADDH